MAATLGGLALWMSVAGGLILSSGRIGVDASNYNGAYGLFLGAIIAPFFRALSR
jgi:hypothetical protein